MYSTNNTNKPERSLQTKCIGLTDENQRLKATLKGICQANLKQLVNGLYLTRSKGDLVLHVAKNLTQFQVRIDQESAPPKGWTKYVIDCDRIQSEEDIETVLNDIYAIPVRFHRVIKEF